MIKLPDFSEQSRYDYETNFHLTLEISRLAKFVAHYEAIRMVEDLPGAIVECGVFKGTSLARFAMFRELLGNYFTAKIIAFDVFSDDFPDTKYEEDKAQREHWIATAGGSSISVEQMEEIFTRMDIKNYELVAGDICKTVPEYARNHAGMKISLLNIDCDFVEPTICTLEHFYERVVKGGIILLDNYAGEGSTGLSYHGDTRGTDTFFADKDVEIRKFPFGARPCYIIKE